MFSKPILLVLLLAAASFSISVLAPQAVEVQNGDTLNLGTIGPGQTVSIVLDRKVTVGGIHGIGGLYDQAQVYDLPKGWGASDSKLYEDPLQVTISAAPDATEGQYSAKVKIIDENNGEGLGEIVLNIKLNVTYDVMNFDVSPPDIKVGPGQPARFAITVTSLLNINLKGTKIIRTTAAKINTAKNWLLPFPCKLIYPALRLNFNLLNVARKRMKNAVNLRSLRKNSL